MDGIKIMLDERTTGANPPAARSFDARCPLASAAMSAEQRKSHLYGTFAGWIRRELQKQ